MPDESPCSEVNRSNLIRAIATRMKLVSNYEQARDRILERRRSATGDVMAILDARLAAKQKTIDSLRREVEISLQVLT